MTASISKSGLPPTSYYAPVYKIEVDGEDLPETVINDVLDVKVVLDKETLSSFELTVSNWDDSRLFFKYSDTTLFDLGRQVKVAMGYADRVLPLIVGRITTMSPKFPSSGEPTVAISGVDSMVLLKESKPKEEKPKKYIDMADWEIAQMVAEDYKLPVKVTREGRKHPLVIQGNQDDATFLKERAARIDFECYVLTDPITGKDELHFERPKDGRAADTIRVFDFTWGENLIEFNPTLTLSSQVASVTVRGWDSRKKEPIAYKAEEKDIKREQGQSGKGTSGAAAAKTSLGNRQDVVVDAFVATEDEARELAISLINERAYDFITGSGKVIGLPDLRPGDNVNLEGLGDRFRGTYYVKKVEHLFNGSGYLTTFEVRRIHDEGAKKK